MPCIRNVGRVRPQPFFLYVPAISNVVTTWNSTVTKNVLKWNRALGYEFSIQSSVYGATAVAKANLFSTSRSAINKFTLVIYHPNEPPLLRPSMITGICLVRVRVLLSFKAFNS